MICWVARNVDSQPEVHVPITLDHIRAAFPNVDLSHVHLSPVATGCAIQPTLAAQDVKEELFDTFTPPYYDPFPDIRQPPLLPKIDCGVHWADGESGSLRALESARFVQASSDLHLSDETQRITFWGRAAA